MSANVEPYDLTAEEAVLSACLGFGSGNAIDTVKEIIEPKHFYRASHGIIFRSLLDQRAAHPETNPDALLVTADLEHNGALENAGGQARIAELVALSYGASNVDRYALIVLQHARSREVFRVGQQLIDASQNGGLDKRESLRADLRRLLETGEDDPRQRGPILSFMQGEEFLGQPLGNIRPLIGHGDQALLLPGSLAILAGIGGVGKTTMVLHAMAHWAAGLPWFGIPTDRPLRFCVIENEGPHDPFVNKVKQFAARFHDCPCNGELHGDHGEAIRENCFFLDGPWGRFTFGDDRCADELRDFVIANDIDIVLANPLSRLGMKGAGTPEECLAFLDLLFKAGLNEHFAALLNHHMSKATKQMALVEQLSGAWGPHPDAILTLEPNGERSTKLTFAKARWGEDLQGKVMLLYWLDAKEGPVGYKGEVAPQGITDDEVHGRLEAFLREHQPANITRLRKGVQGKSERIGEVLLRGLHDGRYEQHGDGRKAVYTLPGWEGGEPTLWKNDPEQDE